MGVNIGCQTLNRIEVNRSWIRLSTNRLGIYRVSATSLNRNDCPCTEGYPGIRRVIWPNNFLIPNDGRIRKLQLHRVFEWFIYFRCTIHKVVVNSTQKPTFHTPVHFFCPRVPRPSPPLHTSETLKYKTVIHDSITSDSSAAWGRWCCEMKAGIRAGTKIQIVPWQVRARQLGIRSIGWHYMRVNLCCRASVEHMCFFISVIT